MLCGLFSFRFGKAEKARVAEASASTGQPERLKSPPASFPEGRFNQALGVWEVQWPEVRERQGLRYIDVRELAELRALPMVERGEHVPLGELNARAEAWPRGAALVVICRSGGRSGRAVLALEAMGFTNVVSLAGGMLGVARP